MHVRTGLFILYCCISVYKWFPSVCLLVCLYVTIFHFFNEFAYTLVCPFFFCVIICFRLSFFPSSKIFYLSASLSSRNLPICLYLSSPDLYMQSSVYQCNSPRTQIPTDDNTKRIRPNKTDRHSHCLQDNPIR